MIGTIKGKI